MVSIRRLHEYYSHPSINEMKRVACKWFKDEVISYQDRERWYELEGKYCTGCLEGKLKEHARKLSTNPLSADQPGDVP